MYENKSLIPDWDTFRLVLAIDRFGGISGAAKSLGVTHATISRRLARAENEAGMQFFDRLPAGLRLTKVGAAILKQAQTMEPGLDQLERALVSTETGLAGPLRVTLPPLLLTGNLAGSIARFAEAHPEIELHFVGDNQLLNLHQREADVAIRVTHKPPETLWGRKLTEQSAAFYAEDGLGEKNSNFSGGSFTQASLDLFFKLGLTRAENYPNCLPERACRGAMRRHGYCGSDGEGGPRRHTDAALLG